MKQHDIIRHGDGAHLMKLKIELEQEEDGRWIAEIPDLQGVLCYGATSEQAIDRVRALALRVVAERLENGEQVPELDDLFAVAT